MGDPKRTAEPSVGAPLVDGEGMAALLMVMDSVRMKPGPSGPGDEWKFPAGPGDQNENADDKVTQPEPNGHGGGLLRRLARRG